MKVVIASAALALLPATMASVAEKRGLDCSTVYGQGNAKIRVATQIKDAGRVVNKTVRTRHTVMITPTVSRTLTGTITSTDSVTATSTGKPITVTVTGSSTSTVPAQPGFTAASGANPKSNTNTVAKKALHLKREAEAAPARVAVSVVCTRNNARVQTATVTVAAKPYITKYARAVTKTINRQQTRRVEKIVATTTIHRKEIVELPRATHWAACDAENLLGWTWGNGAGAGSNSTFGNSNGTSSAQVGISSVILVAGTTAKTSDTSTAAQCCIQCQTTPGCVGSQWRSGVCSIHIRPAQFGACSKNQAVFNLGSFFANPLNFLGSGEGYILSNGRCGGAWKFGGLTS